MSDMVGNPIDLFSHIKLLFKLRLLDYSLHTQKHASLVID